MRSDATCGVDSLFGTVGLDFTSSTCEWSTAKAVSCRDFKVFNRPKGCRP